jgi:hypothetical protein
VITELLRKIKKKLATDTHRQNQTSCCATCTTATFSPPAAVFKSNLPEADNYPLIKSISGYVF